MMNYGMFFMMIFSSILLYFIFYININNQFFMMRFYKDIYIINLLYFMF